MDQPDFQSIAAQLRNPNGEDGIKTAVRMSENNANMITTCIDALYLKENDKVLEMGPGGGLHLPYLFQQEHTVQYSGADISETMIEMAAENNKTLVERGAANFKLLEIQNEYCKLTFDDGYFDKIFTVNTIYFWDNALAQAKELLRVLAPHGQIFICFATASFMEQLPFTKFDFNLYSEDKAIELFQQAGFHNIEIKHQKEWVENTVKGKMEREFIILKAGKQ